MSIGRNNVGTLQINDGIDPGWFFAAEKPILAVQGTLSESAILPVNGIPFAIDIARIFAGDKIFTCLPGIGR